MSDSERSDAIGVLRAMALQAADTGASSPDDMLKAELRIAGAAIDLAGGDHSLAKALLCEAYQAVGKGAN